MSREFEKRCEARQSEIRAGSVLVHVTKRGAVITPPRALVVLRFLLNGPQETVCFRSKLTSYCHPINYVRLAETGETFGLATESTKDSYPHYPSWVASPSPTGTEIPLSQGSEIPLPVGEVR